MQIELDGHSVMFNTHSSTSKRKNKKICVNEEIVSVLRTDMKCVRVNII